jgi:anti-sigma factor ChrR (cupin superfamily)
MNETMTAEDFADLDDLVAEAIVPVAPPAFIRERLLAAIAGIPQNSQTVRADEGRWVTLPKCGVQLKKLSHDKSRGTVTLLMLLPAGSSVPAHGHHGPEDSYVVEGSCRIGGIALAKGDFHHVEAGEQHGTVVSDEGCTLLLTVDERDYRAA